MSDMNTLGILVPSRGRPGNLRRLIDAIAQTATGEVRVYTRIDDDDPELNGYLDIKGVNITRGPRILFGPSLNEIWPIADADGCTHLAMFGDDVVPETVGWDRMLIDALGGRLGVAYGSDGMEHLHVSDLPTHYVMQTEIARRLGWFYLPTLEHLFGDNVARELGKGLDNFQYVPAAKVLHYHRWNKKASDDATYQEANSHARYRHDRLEYMAWVDGGGLRDALAKLNPNPQLEPRATRSARMSAVAVTHGYPPEWALGGEVSLHRTMAALGNSASVLTRTDEPYDIDGVNVFPIGITDVLNANADPAPLVRQFAELEATVVIAQNELGLPAVRAARELGIVSVVCVHVPPRFGRGILQSVREADAAIYNTQTSATLWGEPKSLVIHPPVGPLPKKPRSLPKGDAYTCLSNLRNKGAGPILELAALMPEQRFILVRSPAEITNGLANFDEIVAKLPNVEVVPRVTPDEVYTKYLSQTRILLVPSWMETYGMSAIEAAGYGIPTVGITNEHVMEGIGDAQYGIPPLSLPGLIAGVKAIEEDYADWSHRARERAEFLAERQERELDRFVEWLPTHPAFTDGQRRRRAATIRSR